MKHKRKYRIERPQPGVLTHRGGGTEFRFPVYDEDGTVVFVAWPTRQRIFLYFLRAGWVRVPSQFSERDRKRITADVLEYFRLKGDRVRIVERPDADNRALQFHPELFECKGRASEILDTAGIAWFSDYGSIDLLHEELGLEVCGIQEESNVEPISRALSTGFPQWHYSRVCFKGGGREPGWKFALHMFPRRCSGSGCVD